LNKSTQNFKIQKFTAFFSLFLFAVKCYAWYITHSVAILTDALESIVNVIAGFMGLYTIYLSSKPKDLDHPYGHGKAELISAAVEGVMIGVAGLLIIKEAIYNFFHPHAIHKVDIGMILVGFTAIVNFIMGTVCVKMGKKNQSAALISGGKHLMSDTLTTAGIIIGLMLIYLTGITWIDSVVAIIFAFVILNTGYQIIRSSLAGMMDEADMELLNRLVKVLNENRRQNWIDLHNLRIIKYGSMMHIDCHLTVPWYLNVHEAHREIDALSALVKQNFGDAVELFVHSDGCLDFSCAICTKLDCLQRKNEFKESVLWTFENISSDKKHSLTK
jgi:cation diffusion facilitator family transporter